MNDFCPRCQTDRRIVKETRVTGTRVVFIGILAWLFKKPSWVCAVCGAEIRRTRVVKTPGTYRCDKNGHLMNSSREFCPIDGSKVRKA